MNKSIGFPQVRMRRLRHNPILRDLIRETNVSVKDIIYPLFIHHGSGIKREISTMPGCFQLSVDQLPAEIDSIRALGIQAVLLFGLPESKDHEGSSAWVEQGVIARAIHTIKQQAADMLVITDLCFCEYTDHGHCGILSGEAANITVDNDKTLPLLGKQAVAHAQAGADVIAPSGMLDGMVGAIRQALDAAGFQQIPVMSYSAKYASALYGPFRAAVDSTPAAGDRKSYQMDPANGAQALREVELDIAEGADIVMVKPASFYLDVIYAVKQRFPEIPLAAYCVGGEYAMIKAAAANGWINEQAVTMEQFIAIKRAGADMIITYAGKQIAQWLQQ